jgi:hypothetical protein
MSGVLNLERDLTVELLTELRNCSAEELAKLFGAPLRDAKRVAIDQPPAASANAEPEAAEQPAETSHVVWSKPGAELPAEPEPRPASRPNPAAELPHLQIPNPPPPIYDGRGFRISPKLPSSFPRYVAQSQPRGSHWSR